jgi:hypothetical protein
MDVLSDTKLSKLFKNSNAMLITDFNYCRGVARYDEYRLALLKKMRSSSRAIIVYLESGLQALYDANTSRNLIGKKEGGSTEKPQGESPIWFFTDFVNLIYPGDFEEISLIHKEESLNQPINDDNPESRVRTSFAHYAHIWKLLNKEEKLIMFDLEKNSIINTSNETVVMNMIDKGLLTDSEEKLQLADSGWKAFLNRDEQRGDFIKLNQQLRHAGTWHNWRLIILAIILALCVLLFFSEKELFSSLNGIIGGTAALIPMLFKLFETRAPATE